VLTDEARALGVVFDGEKFVVQHGDEVYRYSVLHHAVYYAQRQAEKGISVRYTGVPFLTQDDKRRAEEEIRRQIDSLDPLQSAKIAKQVKAKFDTAEILDLIDFFDSADQLHAAVSRSHEKLEPAYRRAILDWYTDNTELHADSLSDSAEIQDVVVRCMNQGLSAIFKSEALKAHLGTHHPSGQAEASHPHSQVGTIAKGRSWKEISADGK
jgi:hypothetical protein